jgi:hypothetical protein
VNARWEAVGRVGVRAKRIGLIMGWNPNPGWGRIKRVLVGHKGERNGSILVLKAKVYSCCSRARGLLSSISFFIKLIGFKG